jgi:hypothetical protein
MTTREKRPASRTLRGWAIAVLQEAGAIKECEERVWMQDRADPHARQRAFDIAREERPPGASPQAAAVAIAEVLVFDRRQLPRMPAVLDGEHATSFFRTSRFSTFLRRCRLC